jgi:hypothetical protein
MPPDGRYAIATTQATQERDGAAMRDAKAGMSKAVAGAIAQWALRQRASHGQHR